MNTEFGDKLATALEESRNNVNNFVWKGQKVKDANGNFVQEELRLIDASENDLKRFYTFCKTMLFNSDKKHPGRVNLLKDISDQRNRCGVELFYREADALKTTRFAVVDALKSAINKAQPSAVELESLTIGDLMRVSSDYQNLPVQLVIDGGLDKLGRFDRSHITLTFIMKQGLWLTSQERKNFADLFVKTDKRVDRSLPLKKKLGLPEDIKLHFNPSGLTFKELKSMLSLRNKKYSELSTEQLRTLRYKMLFALEDEVDFHISQWNARIYQIEEVAKVRKLAL